MLELILMWAAAIILGAVALAAASVALYCAGVLLTEYLARYRVQGLTAAEVRYVRRVARRLRERRAAQEADRG